jgi:eukaryotic-like serine/threonine-protein kinase
VTADPVILADRYVLESRIAKGGMAEVWRARDDVLARPVAVKILLPHLATDKGILERFKREALAAARLVHPNIVSIYDTGSGEGAQDLKHYIVMEYCGRGSLADLLRDGPVDPQAARAIGAAVCDALAYAHQHEILHRDIKPGNVLVSQDDTFKVSDFGIAKAAFAAGDVTTSGEILGTVTYVPPELVAGEEADPRADLYSLGVVLYELLTGRVPFRGETHMATALMHMHESPAPPRTVRPGIPRDLEEVVMTALEKNREQRFSSAADMGAALGARRDLVPVPGGETARLPGPSRAEHEVARDAASLRKVGPVAAALIAVVAVLVVIAALLGEERLPFDGPGGQPGGEQATQIAVESAIDFDPHGDGEHPDRAPLAIDDDPATSWITQTYRDDITLLKPGVGLLLDLGEPAEVVRVRVAGSGGYDFELRAADSTGADETAFDTVTGVQNAATDEQVELPEPTAARYWLLWLTRVTAEGPGRAEIFEVAFVGR